jgi:predicted RND superfamily exporter protein
MRKFLKIPWVVIGLVLLVTGFLSYQIFANIRLDNDVTRFIPEENPARVAMSEVDDLFGSQMTMLVGLESTDGPIFTPEKLGAIREVTEKLERVVNVNEVTSLMNTDYILSETIGDEEVIEVQSLVPEDFGGSLAEIQEIKRRILSWDLYHRSIVSDDYTSTQIILELEEIQAKEGEEDPKRLSYDGITRVLTETDLHGMKYYLAGTPAMSALMSKNMTADLSFLIPLVVVIVIGALYFSFRRLAGIILPLLTVIISTIWTIGFMATFGVTLTMIGTIIPVLMIAVGSAYGIHVISHYLDDVAHFSGPWNQEANIDMIVKTLRKVGKPVLLAALTTIAGFGSLSFTTIIPMQTFGIFTAVGVAAALVIALTFLPSLLVVFPPRKNTKGAVKAEAKETKGERGIHKFLLGLYNNFVSKKVLVLSIGAVLLALAGLGTSFVVIDNALVDYFKEDTEISLSDRFLREKFNGTKTFSIVLESENKGGMNNPEALLVMDALAQELYSQHDQVKKILSYTDLLKRLNQLFHSDESALGLPTKLALEDEGLSDFGFGFDAEGGSEGFGFDSAESSEGFWLR